jgi:hypothetical protein
MVHLIYTYLTLFSVLGVNPPIKKRKTEDKTLYYSEYESSKRVRNYSIEWET